MKFSSIMEIKAPRTRVVELFRNPDNLSKWQDGFQGIEHVSGTPRGDGCTKENVLHQSRRHDGAIGNDHVQPIAL